MPLFNNQIQPTLEASSSTPLQPALQETPPVEQLPVNKVTINSLLSGIQTPSSASHEIKKITDNDFSQLQERRFVSVKYKIYTLAIVSLLILIYSPVNTALQSSIDKRNE
jgi:hypothetical protein